MSEQRRNDPLMPLLDALERYYQNLSAEDDDGRRRFRETEAWFASTRANDPHDFEAVCAVLECDPHDIRRSLEERRVEFAARASSRPGADRSG